MERKNNKGIVAALFVVVVIAIVAMTGAVLFAILYINEKNENEKLNGSLALANEKAQQMEAQNTQLEEAVVVFNEIETPKEEETANLSEKELEGEESIRTRLKEVITSENGSPIKAVRELFPENFIYYDEDQYVFVPVLDEVGKHSLLSENFIQTEDGQMQYVVDGEVVSHKGIDVSKYQGTIDWQKVAGDGVEFAFIRLGLRGYGSGKVVLDENFATNMSGANAAGVNAGVYFFTQAISVEEAVEEAQFVIDNLDGYTVQCPIVFDVELLDNDGARGDALSKELRTQITVAFCEAIKEAGYTPMIYGNVKCFTKLLDMTLLEDYEKWYAFYDNYMYMPYNVSCWQYTEKGSVDGIKGNVDLNISYKELW